MTNEEIIRKAVDEIVNNEDLLHEYSIMLQASFERVFGRIDTIIHYAVSTLWSDHEEDIRISDICLLHKISGERYYGSTNVCKA